MPTNLTTPIRDLSSITMIKITLAVFATLICLGLGLGLDYVAKAQTTRLQSELNQRKRVEMDALHARLQREKDEENRKRFEQSERDRIIWENQLKLESFLDTGIAGLEADLDECQRKNILRPVFIDSMREVVEKLKADRAAVKYYKAQAE